jgi:hypothetical protein
MTTFNVSQKLIDAAMDALNQTVDTSDDYANMIADVQARIESWAQSRYGESWVDMSMFWLAREYWADQGYRT